MRLREIALILLLAWGPCPGGGPAMADEPRDESLLIAQFKRLYVQSGGWSMGIYAEGADHILWLNSVVRTSLDMDLPEFLKAGEIEFMRPALPAGAQVHAWLILAHPTRGAPRLLALPIWNGQLIYLVVDNDPGLYNQTTLQPLLQAIRQPR